MTIRLGDIFCVNHGSEIAADLICAAEEFWSADGHAKYSHVGIVTSVDGDTFEALSEGVKQCTMDKYIGKPVKIIRPIRSLKGISIYYGRKRDAIDKLIGKYGGRKYPWWRIVLFSFQPLARFIKVGGKDAVCSEIVGLYLDALGCILANPFGLTPDNISDIGTTHRTIEVVYEGIYK